MFSARFIWASSPTAGDLKKIVIVQSLYRGRKARRQLVKRKENAIYRANVAREIEKTEEDYVKNLNVVIEHYLKPLKERMEDEKTDASAMANFNSLFSDIQVIRNYNGNLLNDLRPRMQKWSAHQGIGDIFVQMSAFLKVYTQYVSRYNKAMVELTTYKKSDPRVLEMLKKISEEVGNQEINSFLIRPIQRIPRYRLLLKDLLKHTEEDHNDFQALSSAYKQVSDVAEYIEEKASEAERIGKLLDVQSRLLGNETSIAAPSRKYVREGRLAVGFAKDNKVRRERMVFLFNDLLVDTKPVKKSGVEVFKFKNSYHLVQLLPVVLPDDLKDNRFGFALRADGDTVDVVRFFAASTQERDEWVNELNSLRQDINAKREHHNDLVLERAKKRALKAKLAFSERYRKTDGGEGTASAGNLDAVSEVKEAPKQPAAALLKGMSPRAPNRWEKEHQSRKEEMAEEAGVKPQGHQSRWESRLKAHQERLRSLQGEESGQAAGGEDSLTKEFADDAGGWKSLPATPELTAGSRRKAWRDKRASADLTTLLAVTGGGGNSPVPESPPSPRKSGGLFSTLLRKRDEAKRRDGSGGRRNTMSGTFNTMGISKRSPSWERKKSDEDSSSKEEDALMAGSADDTLAKPPAAAEEPPMPPKLTRKEKRNYRKTFSSVDVAQMSRLQRSWGSSNSDASVVATSLEKLMLEQQEHKQQVHQQQQQHLQKLKESSGEYATTAKVEQQSGSSGRRIRSGAYDESAVAEMMRREASSESLGGAAAGPSTSGAPSPSSSPASSRTKNPFAYLKKRGDDKEKEKEKEKEREKAREKEVVNINPIRGIHLIPTFAAAAAAAYHANNATNAGLGVAPNVAPSPPSLELSDSADTLAGSSAAIIVSPPSGGATSTRGLTNSQSMELDTIAAQPAQPAPPNAARKVRPMSMDLTGKKPDAIRPTDPNGAIDEEWERRKKHLLDEWKKEDREREKLLKAAKNQMKKELKKSARQEKKEKEKEIKDEKKLRKAERKLRPKSMDFSRRRLDSLLQRMASDTLDDSDDEEADGGNADNAKAEGDMSASVATHKTSNAVHLRVRPKTSRAESVPDRVRRERSRSAIGSNGNNSSTAVGDHPAQPTVSTTWMSANEEEALTIEEIDRRIADLKRLRQRRLASAGAGGAPAAAADSEASKPTSRPKSGSRIGSREDGRVDSLSGSGSRERHHQPERRSSATDAMPMSPTAADRKIHSEEMSALAVVTTSSPVRTRSRANTSSNPPPSASSPYSTFSASGSAVTRRDKEKEKEKEKEREREREKEKEKEREKEKEKEREKEASRARTPVSRAAKRVRPVSMDVSGMRLSDLISTGGESGGDRLDARLAAATRPSTAVAKEATTKAAEGAAAKTRRGTALSSGSWDSKRDRGREKEKEKEKDRARGGERDTKEKEKERKSGGSSIGGRESERRNSIVREKEREKEKEKSTKEERRENGHHDGEPEKKSVDKEKEKEEEKKEDKEKTRDKRRSQDKDKPRDRDHAHQRERDRERDNKEKEEKKEKSTKKGSVINPPSGLGANSSSPAGWEERKKDRTSSTKQRAESTS